MKGVMGRVRGAMAIPRAARLLADDRRGTTIIEFAFVAGPLLALIIAVVQTTLAFFAQQNLDTVSEVATRQLMTGSAQQSNKNATQFKNDVCAKLPPFMKCANVMVDVRTASNFSDVNTTNPTITFQNGKINNAWQFTPGGPGQITVARVMYVWDVAKGPLGFDLSTMSNGKRLLVSTSVFKTEPYQ